VSRRLTFVKRLYKGATLKDAADDVGKSQSTENLWAKRWNEDGLGKLTPNFGDRHPPKLGEDERERLLELLEDGEPWKKQEIQHLLNEKFDIEFHPNYLPRLLDDLGLSYAIPRTERPDRPKKLTKSSTNAFLTRSLRMRQMSLITSNLRTTVTKNGRLAMIFRRTVEQRLGSSISRIHNHGTIHSDSTR